MATPEYWRAYRKKRKAHINALARKRYKKNPGKYRQQAKKHVAEAKKRDPDKFRARRTAAQRKWRGIPTPSYEQPETCEACCAPFGAGDRTACIDHCHATGVFRGWLCRRCNRALGLLGDTIQAVARLAAYMQRS